MRKSLTLFSAIILSSVAFSQSDLKLPVVTPPSPEAAAINKNGQLSVGLMSGVAQASIPLYEIKLGGIGFPIALNYASNGIKVDEMPSRVGMNWTLSPTGVVSRIMHGSADDQSTRKQPYSTFPTYSDSIFPYLQTISQSYSTPAGSYETEPDEFRVNAPGLSGKFIIKDNGDILQIPYSNNKIEVYGGPWGGGGSFSEIIITNTEGVKYYFGGTGAYETTVSISNGQYVGSAHTIRTAFYLKKVVLPNGDNMAFNYSSITFSTTTGRSNSLTHVVGYLGLPCNNETACPYNSVYFNESISSVNYQSVYLTNIISSKGDTASFTYETRPDNSDDKRVKNISISAGGFSRNFYLKYLYPGVVSTGYSETIGDYHKRYFLNEVGYTVPLSDTSATLTDSLKYTMTYEAIDELPARLSYAQDYYGYYNGQPNNTLLTAYENQPSDTYSSAVRDPNFNSGVKGMLRRITFPTGGFEELDYEGNTYGANQTVYTPLTASTIGSGNSNQNGYLDQVWYSSQFYLPEDRTCNVSVSASANPGCDNNCNPPTPNTLNIVKLEIQNITTSSVEWTEILRAYQTNTFAISLDSGNIYKLKLTVSGLPNAGSAQINYGTSSSTTNAANPAPGVRVKAVASFDPVSAKTTTKHYKYISLSHPNVSSGVFVYNPVYSSEPFATIVTCTDVNKPTVGCIKRIVSSSPVNDLYLFDGSPWAYSSVIESDDTAFVNGGIEHHFFAVADNDFGETYYGSNPILTMPRNTKTFMQGYENETIYFDKNKDTVKIVYNYYHVDTPTVNQKYRAITARERANYISVNLPSSNAGISAGSVGYCYDINSYTYVSNWIQQDSSVTVDYDANNTSLKTKTVYSYGSSVNTQPIQTKTYSSTGDSLITEMKYPNDYPSTSPYTTMVTKNIISPVVQTKQKRNSTDLNLVRTSYKQWYSSGNNIVIAPDSIIAKKGANSEESRIRYYAYDNAGNILEVAKESGARISYIWDYNKSFPVAEIKNAGITTDSLAYTSFESDGKGYWTFSGSPISESFQPTGSYCYNLNNGNITRAVNSSKTYYVTYWRKNSSGTVSVNSTTATSLIDRNGWTCYQHTVSGASTITVSGTGKIDELRLYPAGSYMTTFTYSTFVGITARNEPNNQVSYYQYDGANRLQMIRDMNFNIVKLFDYRYKQIIKPCLDTAANWQATGVYRCVQGGSNNNYTGERQRQEIDLNNCSLRYLQKRWYSLGTDNTNCPAVSNCTGADKRVVNGVCETGVKTFVPHSSVHNSNDTWTCTFHYVWTDGFVGSNFTETSSTPCFEEL